MKLKILFLSSLILLCAVSTYAQGLAIQGIARDANNTAKADATLPLKFSVYYVKAGTTYTPKDQTISLTTDAFGVFSHVLDLSTIDNTTIFENALFLKIEQTSPSLTISDEKLNYVPYAVSASNGVPTGSIMPYMGTTAPKGWVLCNGADLPTAATALIALIGTTAPDLRGMFLRGAGGSLTHVGPALKEVQEDGLESHLHAVNLDTDTKGVHKHTTTFYNDNWDGKGGNGDTELGLSNDSGLGGNVKTLNTSETGDHKHNVSGNTASTGAGETRPVNYGVNYIIKL
jgi:hypothetical protein